MACGAIKDCIKIVLIDHDGHERRCVMRNRDIGKAYQTPHPFDIVTQEMGDLRKPATELIDYGKNLGLWDCTIFGFGPGKEYPKAVDVNDCTEGPKPVRTRVAVDCNCRGGKTPSEDAE